MTEETRSIRTYPFSEPNPIPILTRDTRLYPYHSFEGYAKDAVDREWKVVKLENDHIEVFILPEVGGKVWGAVVKRNGHEFIYRNEVMKFRNISLRGPWTSGGIEFNFGVIGHTPSTATPVDYTLVENADGSVSCFVGGMDLPSRTHWRVEIRLPADRAYFETNVLWYNPTPLAQPYYNWMTAAAFARNDLTMAIPGNAFLEHSGAQQTWPTNPQGRYLPVYANNTFAGHKSYHVVGELNDFFGGYYSDDDYGFGHWSRYEEMPGQKLWLWALSREGGVWEDLLTDTDGQYVEYQAGRLLVQYSPGDHVNPITQAAFDPGATDRWTETWFPLEGIGGLTDASREGAMHVTQSGHTVTVNINAFGEHSDTLHVTYRGQEIETHPIAFDVLEPVQRTITLPGDGHFVITLDKLDLSFDSDAERTSLDRPFNTDASARPLTPQADKWVFEARELAKGRYHHDARKLFEAALAAEPWNKDALLGLADLEYRRARYHDGLTYARAALQLDAYDAASNFLAGNLYHALRDYTNAKEAYGWSARSMAFRSVSYLRLAEIELALRDWTEATRYANLALDYDRNSLSPRQVLAIIARQSGDVARANELKQEMLSLDPLHHFTAAESFLSNPNTASAQTFTGNLTGEYPEQILLELVIDYTRRGAIEDARSILTLAENNHTNPVFRLWRAWIDQDPSALTTQPNLEFVFPYRMETLAALQWAAEQHVDWRWRYLLALNLWARDRRTEAAQHFDRIGDAADYAPFYIARASLLQSLQQKDPEADLRRAVQLDTGNRQTHIHLVRYLQDNARWSEALAATASARARFPSEFNIDLLHVKSLNNLGRASEAIAILDAAHVLPSENARESHRLYEVAHTIAALDAIDAGDWSAARTHLLHALEWPEHLGQGKPYEPEERLVRFLLGHTEARLGNDSASTSQFRSVVEATLQTTPPSIWDVLALSTPGADAGSPPREMFGKLHPLADSFATVFAREGSVAGAATQVAAQHPQWFADIDGRLLGRALLIQ